MKELNDSLDCNNSKYQAARRNINTRVNAIINQSINQSIINQSELIRDKRNIYNQF